MEKPRKHRKPAAEAKQLKTLASVTGLRCFNCRLSRSMGCCLFLLHRWHPSLLLRGSLSCWRPFLFPRWRPSLLIKWHLSISWIVPITTSQMASIPTSQMAPIPTSQMAPILTSQMASIPTSPMAPNPISQMALNVSLDRQSYSLSLNSDGLDTSPRNLTASEQSLSNQEYQRGERVGACVENGIWGGEPLISTTLFLNQDTFRVRSQQVEAWIRGYENRLEATETGFCWGCRKYGYISQVGKNVFCWFCR